jgi:hypothetical protein
MIENLVGQFMGSSVFTQSVETIQAQHGLNDLQARNAVQATVEGAAEELGGGGGISGIFGKITGLFGGAAAGGTPPALIEKVVGFVTTKTGLDAGMAKNVVQLVLPKVMEFAKGIPGGKGLFG